ncbi:unnamed protein product, partial [Protopolystoma xenopodis]
LNPIDREILAHRILNPDPIVPPASPFVYPPPVTPTNTLSILQPTSLKSRKSGVRPQSASVMSDAGCMYSSVSRVSHAFLQATHPPEAPRCLFRLFSQLSLTELQSVPADISPGSSSDSTYVGHKRNMINDLHDRLNSELLLLIWSAGLMPVPPSEIVSSAKISGPFDETSPHELPAPKLCLVPVDDSPTKSFANLDLLTGVQYQRVWFIFERMLGSRLSWADRFNYVVRAIVDLDGLIYEGSMRKLLVPFVNLIAAGLTRQILWLAFNLVPSLRNTGHPAFQTDLLDASDHDILFNSNPSAFTSIASTKDDFCVNLNEPASSQQKLNFHTASSRSFAVNKPTSLSTCLRHPELTCRVDCLLIAVVELLFGVSSLYFKSLLLYV